MIKKKAIIFSFLFIFLLTSCGTGGSLVMPFEATFHKFVYTLTDDLEEIDFTSQIKTNQNGSYYTLLENEKFEVVIYNDTLAFYNKTEGLFYDTFGNTSENMPESGLNISIKQKDNYELTYKSGHYYNSETDTHINTLTAYKVDEKTVRLLIVTGVEEFELIDKTPIVLPSSLITEELKKYYSNDLENIESVSAEYPLIKERFDLADDLYYITENIPDSEFDRLGLTKNTSREVALSLNYKYSDVKMLLTTVDITIEEDEIIFDISKNRQFRSELIRDKSFIHNIFNFEIDFIEKTASESPKITDAQSKY